MGKVVTFVHSFDCSELLIVPTSHNQVLFLFPDKYIEENKLAFIRYKPLIKIMLVKYKQCNAKVFICDY